jgi:hypothetical protein
MPVEKPSNYTAPIFFPKENYKVSKYMDFTKFISLLYSKSLFFCRLDKLEDKFEGLSPRKNKIYNERWYREIYEYNFLKSNDVNKSVEEDLIARNNIEEKFKTINCVNCWNKYNSESYALWKIYSDIDKGIMITSSVNNLIKSLKFTPENIQLSEVKYINHNTDFIGTGNLNYPIIHKNAAYHYENELRLIHMVKVEDGLIYDWDSEPIKSGKLLNVDLNILIDEITLSPFSPPWFHEIIDDLTTKYNLNKKISFSNLK